MSIIRLGEGGVRVSDDSRIEHDGKYKLGGIEIGGSEVDGVEVEDNEVEKKNQKTSKSKKLSKSKKMVGSDFFIFGARLAFVKLRQAFVKALIFYHFHPKHYIWVQTDVLGFVIGEVLSQLTSNDLGQ